jgi:DNA replication and repair protein RecF
MPARSIEIARLDLANFRNYRDLRVDIDRRLVVLTGANGAGKTNLLEAISFLAPGRGLRRVRLQEIDRRDFQAAPVSPAAPWSVAARISGPAGMVTVGTGREPDQAHGDRRVVRIDGATVKTQAILAQHVNVVWLVPQMDRLFQEGAAPRRRFLDRLVFGYDPDHAARLSAYEQAMRERAQMLKAGRSDPAWLSVLEETMAGEGVAVAAARRDVARRLDQACHTTEGDPFPAARLAYDGVVETWLDQMPALEAEDRLRQELSQRRSIDRDAGSTTLGPHRGDLIVKHAHRGVAATDCSTGEQKALLLGIVLAHAALQDVVRGAVPILLLDEVSAHLDRIRRGALYHRLRQLGGQVWLTGTDPELFAEARPDAHFMTVREGCVIDGIDA